MHDIIQFMHPIIQFSLSVVARESSVICNEGPKITALNLGNVSVRSGNSRNPT